MIDEVKVRLCNLDAGKVVKYDHAMNLATQFMLDYKNDVTYLLSIIEQADKALTYYAEEPYLTSIGYSDQAVEVLKTIRG